MNDYEKMGGLELTYLSLLKVTPQTDYQKELHATAMELLTELRQARWVLIERGENIIPLPFLLTLLFWLTVLHVSFGLFAPNNATVVTVLLISALSVSGALFIVLDMSRPLQGVITVSSAPMHKALAIISSEAH